MATATNKNYLVIGGDGAELKTLKTLAAAKKLADAEGGEVFVDGECVYRADVSTPDELINESTEVINEPGEETTGLKNEPSEESAELKNEPSGGKQKYCLKTLMNIRKAPNINGEKVGTAKQGTVFFVKEIKNDWMRLVDDTFILYGGGEFAERCDDN